MKLLSSLSCILFFHIAIGQVSAYVDYRNYFYAFDNGDTKELEYLPIKSYQAGGNAIAYVNGTDNFKVYFNGSSYNLLDALPQYTATNNLVVYYKNKILYAFDNGKKNILSKYTDNYAVGDSIVGFFDGNTFSLNAYYNGSVQEIENMINQSGFSNFKTGGNVLAYVNYDNHFKIFYRQQVLDLESSIPASYQVATNTVAYVDSFTQLFKVFYNGETYTLENIPPASYSTSEDMVAYVDNNGNFKIFYQGKVIDISPFEPSFYKAENKLIVYYSQNSFSVFYKGKITPLESYIPSEPQINLNCLAYKDRNGYLKVFYDGELQQVSKEKINSFQLTGTVVRFDTGLNSVHFFSKGKLF